MNRFISLLRRTSVVRRLLYLFLLQTVVIALFCAATVRSSVQDIADNLRLSGSQLLYSASSRMESAISEIDMLTKFPVLQAAYGSTSIFDYMVSESADTSRLIAYYRSIQQELMNLLVLPLQRVAGRRQRPVRKARLLQIGRDLLQPRLSRPGQRPLPVGAGAAGWLSGHSIFGARPARPEPSAPGRMPLRRARHHEAQPLFARGRRAVLHRPDRPARIL